MRRIPCAISILRAASVIPLFMLFPQYPATALIVFIAAAMTDALDGFLARKLGVESEEGKILDPIADKVLYIGSLIILQNAAPTLWLFALAILFEALLAALRFIKPYCDNRAANPYGKIKTAFQFCAIAFMMLGAASGTPLFIAFGFALGIAAIPLAWMSFYKHIYHDKKTAPF